MHRLRRSRLTFVVLMSLVIGAYYLPLTRNIYRVFQLKLYDGFWHAASALGDWDKHPPIEDICIVDIGEKSIEELGQYSTWPNLFFADLVDTVSRDNPSLIAFDIFFTESDSLSQYGALRMEQHFSQLGVPPAYVAPALSTDRELHRAIAEAGNVYLSMFGTKEPDDDLVFLPASLRVWDLKPKNPLTMSHLYPPVYYLANAAKGVGLAHINADESGNIHTFPLFFDYEDQYLVNFSFQACLDLLQIDRIRQSRSLELYKGDSLTRKLPLDDQGRFHLRYYGSSGRFRYVQISDVLLGRMEPGFFQNKIVLVGASATGLRDTKSGPLSADIPGVELHANFMQNIMNEDYIHWLPPWLGWGFALLLLLACRILTRRFKPVTCLMLFLGISLTLLLALFVMFNSLFIAMPYSTLFFPWIIGFSAIMINESQKQHHERQKVKHAFEHYVSKAVINDILQNPATLKVGGVKRQACIMFADIRNFSTLCEALHPDEVSGFLHNYFNRNTAIITKHNGMLDKYIGDAILALFNVPVDQDDYQLNACLCALDLIHEIRKIRQENSKHMLLKDLKIGIGIASGAIIAGNLGSDEIFNFTGIGDKMNLASRLESLNKFYSTWIIVDNETWLATKDHFHYRWLDRVCVKGKQEAIDIYELLDQKSHKLADAEAFALYENAIAALCQTDLAKAEALFQRVAELMPDDPPSQVMLRRLSEIDPATWDGVYRHILK